MPAKAPPNAKAISKGKAKAKAKAKATKQYLTIKKPKKS
jgi:hypothetical protein